METFNGIDRDILRKMDLRYMLYAARSMLCNLDPLGGVVYILTVDDGPLSGLYKIGYSTHLVNRYESLKSKYPGRPYLWHVIWCDDPRYIERAFHFVFRRQRVTTDYGVEWFSLKSDDRDWICSMDVLSAQWIRHLKIEKAALLEEDRERRRYIEKEYGEYIEGYEATA